MRDLYNNLTPVKMITSIVGNNDSEGTPAASVDRQSGDSVLVIANIGVSGDTLSGSVKIDVVAEDSDDDSTFAAVTEASYLVGATPDASGIIATIDDAAEDDVLVTCGYVGPKRYFRLKLEFTGTHTNGTPISMVGLIGHLHQAN